MFIDINKCLVLNVASIYYGICLQSWTGKIFPQVEKPFLVQQ